MPFIKTNMGAGKFLYRCPNCGAEHPLIPVKEHELGPAPYHDCPKADVEIGFDRADHERVRNDRISCSTMFVCKNPDCPFSYQSADGTIVVNLVRQLRANGELDAPLTRRLRERAPRIYQNGQVPCAGCGQLNTLAHHTGPGEPPEVNTLLENIELLQNHDILPGAA
jgi:hypothetical protein